MYNFLYRCPATGLTVQGTVDRLGPALHFVAQDCPACGGLHLIDPRTGERPGESAEGDDAEGDRSVVLAREPAHV